MHEERMSSWVQIQVKIQVLTFDTWVWLKTNIEYTIYPVDKGLKWAFCRLLESNYKKNLLKSIQ